VCGHGFGTVAEVIPAGLGQGEPGLVFVDEPGAAKLAEVGRPGASVCFIRATVVEVAFLGSVLSTSARCWDAGGRSSGLIDSRFRFLSALALIGLHLSPGRCRRCDP